MKYLLSKFCLVSSLVMSFISVTSAETVTLLLEADSDPEEMRELINSFGLATKSWGPTADFPMYIAVPCFEESRWKLILENLNGVATAFEGETDEEGEEVFSRLKDLCLNEGEPSYDSESGKITIPAIYLEDRSAYTLELLPPYNIDLVEANPTLSDTRNSPAQPAN